MAEGIEEDESDEVLSEDDGDSEDDDQVYEESVQGTVAQYDDDEDEDEEDEEIDKKVKYVYQKQWVSPKQLSTPNRIFPGDNAAPKLEKNGRPYIKAGNGKISHVALIEHLEARYLKPRPRIMEGDYIVITMEIIAKVGKTKQKKLEKIQGVCTKVRNSMAKKTVTIKKVIHGVGVTRVVPLYHPRIKNVENQGQFKNWRKIFKNKDHPKHY